VSTAIADAARAAAAIVLMTPGLSVIIDAIKESRKIFQRMNSYAIYRIAENAARASLHDIAILCLNFYPLTAVNDSLMYRIAQRRGDFVDRL